VNYAQYRLVELLARRHRNICVVGDDDQCVVQGTRILTDNGFRPVERVRIGSTVQSAAGWGEVAEDKVDAGSAKAYKGKVIHIRTDDDCELTTTPHHLLFARIEPRSDLHYVYLMYRRGRGYRIGTTQGVRHRRAKDEVVSGLMIGANQEVADKVWILKVCRSSAEASFYEQYLAFYYGIPTTVFHVRRRRMATTQELVERLYREIDTESRVSRLMHDLHICEEYPHHLPSAVIHGESIRKIVNFTMFGDSRPHEIRPWHEHRIQLVTSDTALRQKNVSRKDAKDAKKGKTWRVETSRKHYDDGLALAKRLMSIDDLQLVTRARLTAERFFRMMPASHIHVGMKVPVYQDGQITEATVTQVEWQDYEGKVYDLSVPHLRNYIANGIVVHNSIYSWRGADVRLILEFESDYPDAKIIKLEQNYRSTQPILDAAWHVIRHNQRRADKRLWTEKKEGAPVVVHDTANEQEEAFWVAEKIQELRRGGRKLSDFAILCRVNAQSRVFEEVFSKLRLPLQLVGTQRFYERKEIKDVVAYLKLLFNPYDEISLRRVINVPPRGIGDKTISRLEEVATQSNKSLMEVLRHDDLDAILDRRAASAVKRFRDLLVNLQQQAEPLTVSELVTMILDKTGYHEWLREERTLEAAERLENLDELLTAARQFDETYQSAVSSEQSPLAAFLEQTSLSSDLDKYAEDSDRVTMMTLHSAKGLEFPIVFLVGMEQGLLPHARAVFSNDADPRALEEERRLCYVGITRAKEQVYLTYAHRRTLHGRSEPTTPSQFLNEIPPHLTVQRDRSARREPLPPSSPPPSLDLTKILSNPRQPAAAPTASGRYKIGDKVRHSVWGEGIVVKVAPDGTEPFWIEVAFPRSDVGIKKIAPQYAPLERI
jgi:DNA helicase-2/ATP-dependent DNA helicase PcrA